MATLITKNSSTASSVPTAAQLVQGELAVNVTDKRLFTENSSGTVVELGTNPSTLALPNGTANGVAYLNGSKVLTTGSALTYNGTAMQINAASFPALKFGDSGATLKGEIYYGVGGNDINIVNYANGPIGFIINGSEQARLTSTGLGIGTSSPAQKLSVATASGNAYMRVERASQSTGQVGLQIGGGTSSTDWFMYVPTSSNTLTWFGNSLNLMSLDTSGNLGLGVTPSAWNSDYRTMQFGATGLLYGRSGGEVAFGTNWYRDSGGTFRYLTTAAATYQAQASGIHYWFTAPSGTAGNAISFTQAMTLDASGNLRVGTTSGSFNGMTLTTSGANTYISVYGASGYSGGFIFGGGGAENQGNLLYNITGNYVQLASNPAGSYLKFDAAGAERARITSGGDLLVGTTSTYGGPGRINVGFNQSTNFGITLRNTSATATGVFVSFENSGGTGNGSISQTNSTTVAYNTSSDRRLKKNIVSAPQAGADIDAIQVVSHGWVSNDDTVKYGVIAQDLAVVAPLAVTKGDDGDEIERVWGVDYSKLVPMLIKEVQALRTRVAALESNP